MLTLDSAQRSHDEAYLGVSSVAEQLTESDFFQPTRCAAWVVSDVLFHLLRDAQRALVAFATPADGPADVDFVAYWRPFRSANPGALAYAREIRLGASSIVDPRRIVSRWAETAAAVRRCAAKAVQDHHITTQGHTLAVPDFLATLAVEATIHHLDMIVSLARADPPTDAALAMVRRTLDGLVGSQVPAHWTDTEYILKGTGRLPLSDADCRELRTLAARFPLFS